MRVSELILKVKNQDSFFTLLPVCEVKTKDDVEKAKEAGYAVALTSDEFQKKYDLPLEELQYICYAASGFGYSYYWNSNTMVVFPMIISGEDYLSPNNKSMSENIEIGKKTINEKIVHNDYWFIITALNDKMRMEYLKMLIDKNIPNLYEIFLSVYTNSDYGCSIFDFDDMKKIMQSKTEEQKQETHRALMNFPEIITVYRGCGDKSTPLTKAYSWSLDSSVAAFFAVRLAESGCIHIAHVKRDDIWEYIDGIEQECLISPEAIMDVHTIDLYDFEQIQDILSNIACDYQYYLSCANYEKMNFEHSSTIHGEKHCKHVLIFSLMLAYFYDLDDCDIDILAEASLYHDTGRLHDGEDRKHGTYSAKKYKRFCKHPDPIVLFLMKYHCKPDKEGICAIEETKELAVQKERVQLLFEIFKDADALDRFRLGHYGVDITQLRTEEARKLVLAAYHILDFE